MPRRTGVAELRARVDGLAIAFFAVTSAVVEALVEVHPDDTELWGQLRLRAEALVMSVDEVGPVVFPTEVVEQALAAVFAAFSGRQRVDAARADNDNDTE